MRALSESQTAVFKDIKRILGRRNVCYFADIEHLDGRTIRSLAQRGLIRFQGFEIELVESH